MASQVRSEIEESKRALRWEVRQRLKSMTAAQAALASQRARSLLKCQAVWQRATSVLFYAPMAGELDVWPLIEEALAKGKQVLLPRSAREANGYVACKVGNLETDVVPGRFGVREAAAHCAERPLNRLDLVLVPGVAFDLHGRRLGRGKGHYDRLLSAVRGIKCGIAFDEQLVSEVPVGPHDVLLNCILTPSRWIELKGRADLE